VTATANLSFRETLKSRGLSLPPLSLDTLQVNVTRLCNQACRHCHVDASPRRTEQMDARTSDACLAVLRDHPKIATLDLTGGAPELNPEFERLVRGARALGRRVIVRHNLTVTLDPHPATGASLRGLPAFFRETRVEVVSSLPYHREYLTDLQRGRGVFEKSVESLRLLNAEGFGMEGSGLLLHLVHNPAGAWLPPPQEELEREFRAELLARHGVRFNRLLTITNMPIHRFREELLRAGGYEAYLERLRNAFHPRAAEGVMCRTLLSVGHDGRLYDCDFNQMLGLGLRPGAPRTIFEFAEGPLRAREIVFADHCFGCTAGRGSSCGGATAPAG